MKRFIRNILLCGGTLGTLLACGPEVGANPEDTRAYVERDFVPAMDACIRYTENNVPDAGSLQQNGFAPVAGAEGMRFSKRSAFGSIGSQDTLVAFYRERIRCKVSALNFADQAQVAAGMKSALSAEGYQQIGGGAAESLWTNGRYRLHMFVKAEGQGQAVEFYDDM